jgi:uncharacterized damage-inducible protein DinB
VSGPQPEQAGIVICQLVTFFDRTIPIDTYPVKGLMVRSIEKPKANPTSPGECASFLYGHGCCDRRVALNSRLTALLSFGNLILKGEQRMTHPLVQQLYFTRSEFERGLGGVTGSEAQQRFGNLNCLSWIIGHLAWQEQRYWLTRAQGQVLLPMLNELLAYGKPACTPPVEEMWEAWRQVTQAAGSWLESLTTERLQEPLAEGFSSTGTFLYRTIYHYWYHLGEGMAVRQLLGNTSLPEFVGNQDDLAPYLPESGARESLPLRVDEFIERVSQARSRWEAVLAELQPEQMLLSVASGEWTVKDIIAHVTWHERQMLGLLQSRTLAGSNLWNLPLNERNQAIYEENRNLPLETVLSEAQATYISLIEEVKRLEQDDLNDPGRFKEMPAEWKPWQVLAENTYLHYQDHTSELEGWLRQS